MGGVIVRLGIRGVWGFALLVWVVLLCAVSSEAFAAAPEAPETGEVTGVSATAATLHGVLNPGGPGELGVYYFAYAPGGLGCTEGAIVPEAPEIALGSADEAVSIPVSGLTPGTLYTVCLVARNTAEESAFGPPITFTTPAIPVAISDEHATEVTAASATLGGEINPGGAETTYQFEYGTGGAYSHSTPLAGPLPADNSQHGVSVPVEGLAAATEYNYRLSATNETGTEHGLERHITTQPQGGPVSLPDGRQYQLVSPPEKDGAQVYGIVAENGVVIGGTGAVQASVNGNSVTYLASAPVGANPPGNSSASQIFSSRAGTGWESSTISQAHENPVGNLPLGIGEPFRLFSDDLSQGVLQESYASPVVLRDDRTGVSQTLATGELPPPAEFEAATPDLTHLLLNGGERASTGLYEWSAGTLAQINILENGEEDPGSFLGGYDVVDNARNKSPSEFAGRHAISGDGSRVVWGDATDLFSRDVATEETIQLDAAQGGSGSGGGVFQLASSDGTRVFFTDQETLTPEAVANSLYLYDIPHRQLTDLGPVGILHAEDPSRTAYFGDEVLGADEAGTKVYVGSEEVLTEVPNAAGEVAVAGVGAGNLFALDESPVGSGSWTVSFIATLSASDEAGYNPHPGAFSPKHLAHAPVRVSPNGAFFAFMSDRSLTKYDNRDAHSGIPDEEVFLYDAAGALVCASCDPSGARPVGVLDTGAYPGLPMDPAKTWGPSLQEEEEKPGKGGHWLVAAITGWNEAIHNSFANAPFELPLYDPRALSDAGQLFFDGTDALVPQDVNGREDVYEYEPPASGGCTTGGSSCVSLISSGRGAGDSNFVDASVGGGDVFFTTADKLVRADVDGEIDMYDAHVCSGAAPCLAEAPATAPACGSSDACRAAQALQPGVFGVSGSATFSGVGNLAPVPKPKPVLTPAQLRAKALARTLKACRKKHGRKRTACEAQARKRYGPKVKSKKARAGTSGVRGSVNGGRGGK
jgi:hypothetical protein